ncbi:TMEM175 family protein [Labrys okinawensis]|uniref:TMEM175 family protein n=1 Tax=Labrys okinawensis TaxID=346911 RepID=UPI0039BC4DF1
MSDMQIGEMQSNTDRLNNFSDAIIAVIITLMVLELKAPSVSSFAALLPLWPEAVSYALSYLFIAIIWINHHHLMRFVMDATPRLIWINFAHLFLVALVPFATQWVARTELGSVAVCAYAALFVCIDAAFLVFEREVMSQADCTAVPDSAKKLVRRRSLTTLGIFAAASLSGYFVPAIGIALILVALSFFLTPEVPGMKLARPRRPMRSDEMEKAPEINSAMTS